MVAVLRQKYQTATRTRRQRWYFSAPRTHLPDIIEIDIPARLDALPLGGFHVQIVVALGVTWNLDETEPTMTGALSGVLEEIATSAQQCRIGAPLLSSAPSRAHCFSVADRPPRPQKVLHHPHRLPRRDRCDGAVLELLELWPVSPGDGAGTGGGHIAINSTHPGADPGRVREWTIRPRRQPPDWCGDRCDRRDRPAAIPLSWILPGGGLPP